MTILPQDLVKELKPSTRKGQWEAVAVEFIRKCAWRLRHFCKGELRKIAGNVVPPTGSVVSVDQATGGRIGSTNSRLSRSGRRQQARKKSRPFLVCSREVTKGGLIGISLSQRGHIDKIFHRFGMSDCKPQKVPLSSDHGLRKWREGDEPADQKLYQQIIGCLIYLVTGTRPDIAYVTMMLSQYASQPNTNLPYIWVLQKECCVTCKGPEIRSSDMR